jgi:hypothetical protein
MATSTAVTRVWLALEDRARASTPFERMQLLGELGDLGYLQPQLMLRIVDFVMNNPAEPDANQPLSQLHVFDQADVLRKVPKILRSVAFSDAALIARCVQLLWQLGRDEEKRFGAEESAFEVLLGLARYGRFKPVQVNVAVLNAMESISADPLEQQHLHLPIDVVAPVIAKTFEDTEERGGSLIISRLKLDPKRVESVRKKALDILESAVRGANPRSATKAVDYLVDCLRQGETLTESPEATAIWLSEQQRVLDILESIRDDQSKGLLHVTIVSELSWHAQLNPNEGVRERATGIIAGFEGTPAFDWNAALIPAVARQLPSISLRRDYDELQRGIDNLLERVVKRILAEKTQPDELASRLLATLHEISEAGLDGSAGWLFVTLANKDLEYAKRVTDVVIAEGGAKVGDSISPVIVASWRTDQQWVSSAIDRAMASGEQRLYAGVAHALWMLRADAGMDPKAEAARRAPILSKLLVLGDSNVREIALRAVGTLVSIDRTAALELLLNTDLGDDAKTADELFANIRTVEVAEIDEPSLQRLVDYMVRISELDYWVMEFLRKLLASAPQKVLNVLMRRIERGDELGTGTKGYKPVPYGHAMIPHEVLFFKEFSPTSEMITDALNRAFAMDERGRFWFAQLISNLALNPGPVFSALEAWPLGEGSERLLFVAQALQRVPVEALYANVGFVGELVNRAAELGENVERRVNSFIFSAATSGVRSGVPFEPMPQDVQQISNARAARERVLPGSAMDRLLEAIERHGQESIVKKLETDIDAFGEPG